MGRIHSVFSSSLNLEFGDKLLHLAKADAPLVSFGICVDAQTLTSALRVCCAGDTAVYQKQRLMLYSREGVFTFPLDAVSQVDLRVRQSALAPSEVASSALLDQIKALPFAEKCGLDFTLDSDIARCLYALQTNNTDEWHKAASFLLGRGLGLTPAGDDFLYGYTLAKLRYGDAKDWMTAMDALDWKRTTAISTAYYRALQSGFSSENWLAFCSQDIQPRGPEMDRALGNVLRCGHTSGYDTVLGFTTGMQSIKP